MEKHGCILVDILHEENAISQTGEQRLHFFTVEFGVLRSGCAFQSIEHAHLVALRLKPAEKPCADIGERLVVQIDRILRRQQTPQTERPPLFQHGYHRALRRRIRRRREIAVNLIHVKQRAQGGRATLRPHPAEHLIEQQAYEEHALGIVQVSDGKNGDAWLAIIAMQHLRHIQGSALKPSRETRRCQQAVELHSQRLPGLFRIKALQVNHPHLAEVRTLNLADQFFQIQPPALRPFTLENRPEQHRLRALRPVCGDTH